MSNLNKRIERKFCMIYFVVNSYKRFLFTHWETLDYFLQKIFSPSIISVVIILTVFRCCAVPPIGLIKNNKSVLFTVKTDC